MRKVKFNPAESDTWLEGSDKRTGWDTWQAQAQTAIAALGTWTTGPKPELDDGVWTALKRWLLKFVFHGKCAYCEVMIAGGFWGEGEHYRPKGKVTVSQKIGNSPRRVQVKGPGGEAHPGYFWLAYDWQNLVPACQECNNRKRDQFPVANTHVRLPAPTTEELDLKEGPLIIHPYRDEPSQYLRFGINGIVTAIDDNPKGCATIEVLGLDRYELTELRKRRQEESKTQALDAVIAKIKHQTSYEESLKFYIDEDAQFSAAVRDYVNFIFTPQIINELTGLRV